MDDIEEVLRTLRVRYPLVPHTGIGRLYSTLRRMKAEKEAAIPVNRRTGWAISVKYGRPANELDDTSWEDFYGQLRNQLREQFPEQYENLFGTE